MGILDVLSRYQQPASPPPDVLDDFDVVAREASEEDLEYGLEEAFRSEETPPFEQMLGQLFEESDDDQRAEVVNRIGESLGPAALGGLASGPLADVIRRAVQNRRAVSARDMHNIPAREIEKVAADAARADPGIMQRVSRFYARHPQLVRTLGQAALAIAMSRMGARRRI